MGKTSLEWTDDIITGDRIIKICLAKTDLATAKFDRFDYALFDDIDNGEPSDTPMADILLGIETMMRRIELATKPTKE